jgi:WhiB family transcriptional regulator, redox-sensing transcriptional regulator
VNWHERALCAEFNPEMWFPDKGSTAMARDAKQVCGSAEMPSCPVREQCLEYALTHNMQDGIWGGMAPRERKNYKRARNRPTRARTHCDAGHELARVGRRGDGRCAECANRWDRARRRDGGAA